MLAVAGVAAGREPGEVAGKPPTRSQRLMSRRGFARR